MTRCVRCQFSGVRVSRTCKAFCTNRLVTRSSPARKEESARTTIQGRRRRKDDRRRKCGLKSVLNVGLSHTSVSDLKPPSCDGVYKQEEQSKSERGREAREQLNTFNTQGTTIHCSYRSLATTEPAVDRDWLDKCWTSALLYLCSEVRRPENRFQSHK
jgi:hypothetical protein